MIGIITRCEVTDEGSVMMGSQGRVIGRTRPRVMVTLEIDMLDLEGESRSLAGAMVEVNLHMKPRPAPEPPIKTAWQRLEEFDL